MTLVLYKIEGAKRMSFNSYLPKEPDLICIHTSGPFLAELDLNWLIQIIISPQLLKLHL